MPAGSLVVGVDLMPIKAIRNVKTIVSDITTAECRSLILYDLGGYVLCVCMHVCTYVCTYIRLCINILLHIQTKSSIFYNFVILWGWKLLYLWNVYVYVCMYVCMYYLCMYILRVCMTRLPEIRKFLYFAVYVACTDNICMYVWRRRFCAAYL